MIAPLALLLLAGCAADPPLPDPITTVPPGNLQLVEVMRDPAAAAGARIRWGGNVVALADEGARVMRVEVLERELEAHGWPLKHGSSDGRFAIRAAPGVDPRRYRLGSEVTVSGRIEGTVTSSLGREIPVVHVEHFVRWEPPPRYDHPHWYDDPWWGHGSWHHDPWYPHGHRSGVRFGIGIGL